MPRIWPWGSPAAHPILENLDLAIDPGERLLIEGASGCGKSPLGLLLAGMAWPSAGTIRLGGVDYERVEPGWFRQHVGYLPSSRCWRD